jgi:hypothetical protein
VDDRICSDCGGAVSWTDVACRHCGSHFQVVTKPGGSFLNVFFRLLLGAWALALSVFCIWVGLTAPKGLGDLAAYLTNRAYFVPWFTGIVSLAVLAWLTEERR